MKTLLVPIALLVLFTGISYSAPGNFAPIRSVLGQSDFTSEVVPATPTASSLNFPEGIAVDPTTGKVFVADSSNNRILRFSSASAYTTNAEAEAVLGQTNFTSNSPNRGGAANAGTLDYPTMLAFDSEGRLWVTDYNNNRVLRFDTPSTATNGQNANGVLGQLDFSSIADAGTAGPHSGFDGPYGIAVDSSGNLWVSDFELHRVLRFDNAAAKADGGSADAVLGQPDLGQFSPGTSSTTLSGPSGVSVGSSGELWVADSGNRRVLQYPMASTIANGTAASGVLGQADFDSAINRNVAANTITSAFYVTAAPDGILWVSDYSSVRVLGFRAASSKENFANADIVLGRPDFTSAPHLPASRNTMRGPGQVALGREGSLLIAVFDESRVVRFSDAVTVKPKKKTIKTSKKRVTFRGKSTGASKVQYRVAGQGGYRKVRGSLANWRGKTKKISKRRTRVTLRATAFDGVRGTGKMKIISK